MLILPGRRTRSTILRGDGSTSTLGNTSPAMRKDVSDLTLDDTAPYVINHAPTPTREMPALITTRCEDWAGPLIRPMCRGRLGRRPQLKTCASRSEFA